MSDRYIVGSSLPMIAWAGKENKMKYAKHVGKRSVTNTPQMKKIPKRRMKKNDAGGYSFAIDDWARLDRFLILGTEGGIYYTSERKLTRENAKAVEKCIKKDGQRVVNRIIEISTTGRAPKNDPAIFALAMCAKLGDLDTRRASFEALPKVCRIGTHLFNWADGVEAYGGWGRGTRKAAAKWYNDKQAHSLAYQVAKYQQRNGWSHRDILRLSHPRARTEAHDEIYKWIVKGVVPTKFADELEMITALEKAKKTNSVPKIVNLILKHGLPRECIPTEYLNEKRIWDALLQKMPYTALIRNLATMTRVGLLSPLNAGTSEVVSRLANSEALRKARVHPIQVLSALMTYKAGRGARGKHTWTPVPQVMVALEKAFYASFGNVKSTGKRTLYALDVSSSMGAGFVAGVPGLSPKIASAAMALVLANREPNHMIVGFTSGKPGSWQDGITRLDISPNGSLADAIKVVSGLPFGGTDCALPMKHAMKTGLDVDSFVILTDNDTWAGAPHPSQALIKYRDKTGIASKLVTVGMTSNGFSIADPQDSGMIDVVGFDTATPSIIADFVG